MNSIEKTIGEINRETGDPIAFSADDSFAEPISTGIMPLDVAIGIGGLPKGRIVELHSVQSSGKSSLSLAIISSFQKQGITCAYLDAEFSYLTDYAQKFGVDTEKLLLFKTSHGEQAFMAMEKLIRSNKVGLIVVDSVSGLVPLAEAEGEHGKVTIGAQAKLMSKGLAKIVGPLHKSGCIIIFINQLRMNIMGGQYDPYTLPGGMSLRHYSSIMLELHRKGALMQGDAQVGIEIEIKVKKNKVGIPGEKCTVQLLFASGFSGEVDVLNAALRMGIVTKDGNTLFFGDIKLGVGQNRARKFLVDNPEIMAQIKAKL